MSELTEDLASGITWASTPGAKAQLAAAKEAARRIGASLSDTELTVVLWAANDAAPEPVKVIAAYWTRAAHCCDPDEAASEIILALDAAGFAIQPKPAI